MSSELPWLLTLNPVGYAELVLNGGIEYYLDKFTTCWPKDERE